MQAQDFAIWIFAALMILSPLTMAATKQPYKGEPVATTPVTAPALNQTAPKP